ncbi:MAG: PDZ domain-containing protein [Saprospiraceae bacterium]|nr:PDZ domain-containing protein [Saprospiraceae bacterium]
MHRARIVWRGLVLMSLLLSAFMAPGQNMRFDILDGEDRVEIPFEFKHNFILIDVRLFGLLPMQFIFDTGAEHTILFKREYADFLNVQYDLRIPIVGSDQQRHLYALVARSVDLELVGLAPQKRDILVLEDNYFHLDEITGTQIHGIIGGGFFRNVVVQIDYKKQRLILHNGMKFEPPGRSFRQINVEMVSNKPYLQATGTLLDDTTLDLQLLVDTGAGLPLLLHSNSHPKLAPPEELILGKLGVGLGGYVQGSIGRIKSLQIEDIAFEFVLTSFQDLSDAVISDSLRNRNGLVGNQLLGRFDVYIDYMNEKIYLRPQGRYKRKFKMDRSGMIIFALGHSLNEFVVQDLIAGSPAAEAGIQPGDIIRRIQGLPAKFFSLDQVTALMQKRVGKRIRLVIQRKQQIIKVHFRLRELI